MQKIISVFQRNYDTDRLIRNEVVPGAEWVLAGEGRATRKWDGACCMVRDGQLYKRYELKAGKTPPANFEPAQEGDSVTGAIPGWLPVGGGPEDQWFRAALDGFDTIGDLSGAPGDGTYEAIGPHFGGGHHSKNPEGCARDLLVRHGRHELENFPRTFYGMREYFLKMGKDASTGPSIEGVVFHHPDGRMAKVKARDFGVVRPHEP